jgi:elongation factor G
MGHTGSGKTSLTDALLFKLGLNDRLGAVAAGSSMADYTDEEKDHKITIFSKPFSATYKTEAGKPHELTWIDTPGYMDFFGQVIAASYATESSLIAVDAVAGVQVGTRRAWNQATARNLARAIVVTGLDRENADFQRTLSQLQEAFGGACVPVVVPAPGNAAVMDVLAGKNVPANLADQVQEMKSVLMEKAAETNDVLIEKFLGGEALTAEETARGLRAGVANGTLVPVFACMPLKGIGISELLEGVARLFPSPADKPAKDEAGKSIATGADSPFVGQVWRSVNDPFIGHLSFLRVLGGTLSCDSEIMNSSKGHKERISALQLVNGKKVEPVQKATAGDIVAIPKLKFTGTSDTLCSANQKVLCAPLVFPKPVTFMAVTAKTQADEDKIGTALARVCEEDPTLSVDHNKETKEMVLQGFGDMHIGVVVSLMKSHSKVNVVLSTPKVPYRETVTALGEGHYKHKKQSGGRGQFGEVYLRVKSKPADDPEWFVDDVVGGVIPGNFIPAVQKGVAEGMLAGGLAGYPVTNIQVSVYDGSYHEVDSSEISFKIAGARALRDAMSKARPVLLEPIMSVKVTIPEQFIGDITGDINHKRGRIMGVSSENHMQIIQAEIPYAELFKYAAELRSVTAGQGTFEMEYSRYDSVPSNVAQKVIAASAKDKKQEEED